MREKSDHSCHFPANGNKIDRITHKYLLLNLISSIIKKTPFINSRHAIPTNIMVYGTQLHLTPSNNITANNTNIMPTNDSDVKFIAAFPNRYIINVNYNLLATRCY